MKQDFVRKIEGYDEIVRERAICRKYGLDYSAEGGKIRSFIDRLHPSRLILRVSDVIDETPSAKTLRLVSPEGYLAPFQAGQYISLVADIGPIRTSRPYSISSPPNQRGYYDITVRSTENGFVAPHLLNRIKVGDRIEASAPSGGFCFNPLIHDMASVFIAGGSGITPFMSMIREAVECGLDRTISLFYGNRSDADVIFHDELLRISQRFRRVTYIPVIETPSPGYNGAKGYITGDMIKDVVGETEGRTYYLCGPPAMYDFCLPELERLSIPRHKIRRELYGPPPDITRSPGWPPHIVGGRGLHRRDRGERRDRRPGRRTPAEFPGAQRHRRSRPLPIRRMQPVPRQAHLRQGLSTRGRPASQVRQAIRLSPLLRRLSIGGYRDHALEHQEFLAKRRDPMEEHLWFKSYDKGVPHSLAPYPDRTLIDVVDEAGAERPDAVMMIFKGRRISFGEANRMSDALAAALAAQGVRKGDRVALLMPNTPNIIISQFSVWKAGGVAVPINPLFSESELVQALAECDAQTAIVLTPFYDKVKAVQPRTTTLGPITAIVRMFSLLSGSNLLSFLRRTNDSSAAFKATFL